MTANLRAQLGLLVLGTLLWVPSHPAFGGDTDQQTRVATAISYKLSDHYRFKFTPELRLDEDIALEKYLLKGELVYKAMELLSLGLSYRFIGNLGDEVETEHLNQFAFSAEVKHGFNRLEPDFRIRYSNYADDDITDKAFLRYRASVKYDIASCKATPGLAMEAFHQMADWDFYKFRTTASVSYKLFKNNFFSVSYKYDFYPSSDHYRQILCLDYKVKL